MSRVTIETRERLLRYLNSPKDLVIVRDVSDNGDRIKVLAYPGCTIEALEVPPEFEGFEVVFVRSEYPVAY